MDSKFDTDSAKNFLENREKEELEKKELERLSILSLVIDNLKAIFSHGNIEVYLVGSITQPYKFSSHSDVDIVLKNFKGDRFDIWTQLELRIQRNVEVIIFEHCHFQDYVIKNGYKVI